MPFPRQPPAGPKIDARRKRARETARLKRQTNAEFARRDRAKARKRSWRVMLAKFGLTEQDAFLILKKQKNRCPICGVPFVDYEGRKRKGKPHLDHRRGADRIRGFLCHGCNSLIGFAHDDIEILKAAIHYLEESRR